MITEPYSYCFLRYHHEPLSGEFANIGVLVWAPKSNYLGFLGTDRYSRLSAFFHHFDHGDYRNLISRITTAFDKLSQELAESDARLPLEARYESAREVAIKVVPHDSAALQWSRSGGGLTESPASELEHLFEQHIQSHYSEITKERRDAKEVYRQVYERAFSTPSVSRVITEHEVKNEFTEHTFPQAWKNGIWNVYQTLSFDLVNPDQIRNKAHRWESLTRYVREGEELNVTYLLGKPESRNQSAYGTAKKLLANSQATLIEEDEIEDFARNLESKVMAAT